jgi:hypothetical protein
MSVADRFALPENPYGSDPTDNVAKNMADVMNEYLTEAQSLEHKAELLMALPDHDEEGQAVRESLITQAAAFRRAAKTRAQRTWQEKDRSA